MRGCLRQETELCARASRAWDPSAEQRLTPTVTPYDCWHETSDRLMRRAPLPGHLPEEAMSNVG